MMSKKKRPVRISNPDTLVALLEEWPKSWAGLEDDEAPGRKLLVQLRPFIMGLIEQGLSAKTVRRHLDNLWAIGGEVVRRFNDEPHLRHEPARQLLLDAVEMGEAPLFPHATEADRPSADTTARKLLKFLLATETPPS